MTEQKKFECPSCGADSWIDVATLQVTHAEPTCADWQRAQVLFEPAPTGAVVVPLPVDVVHFDCPECKGRVRMRPLEQPIAVEHSIPSCAAWSKVEGKRDDLERYLIKAGAHIHVPNRD